MYIRDLKLYIVGQTSDARLSVGLKKFDYTLSTLIKE